MNENGYLLLGWLYFLIGGFVAAFAFAAGMWGLVVIWGFIFLLGAYFLFTGFRLYQWPHRYEYIQYWRDMIAMHTPTRKGKSTSTH